jgi:hypothetical protein
MRMRVLARRSVAPDQVGAVFQETPWDVEVAWNNHRTFLGRRLVNGEAQGFCDTLLALKRAVRRSGRVCGYFATDGWLFGYGGPAFDPKWTVIPDTCPICERSV